MLSSLDSKHIVYLNLVLFFSNFQDLFDWHLSFRVSFYARLDVFDEFRIEDLYFNISIRLNFSMNLVILVYFFLSRVLMLPKVISGSLLSRSKSYMVESSISISCMLIAFNITLGIYLFLLPLFSRFNLDCNVYSNLKFNYEFVDSINMIWIPYKFYRLPNILLNQCKSI